MMAQFRRMPPLAQFLTLIVVIIVAFALIQVVFSVLAFLFRIAFFVLVLLGILWVFDKVRK